MPGHNQIHYSREALRRILQKHINSEALQGNITVTAIEIGRETGDDLYTVVAHVTSDQPETKEPQCPVNTQG